jgi:pantetheine-phosphate adenylyltransferase
LITALYPGSFDPITNGHIDIAKRASLLFDKVIIAVYDIPQKKLLFSIDERMKLAKASFKGMQKIQVTKYSGITVDYARKIRAKAIIRGIRNSMDYEHEYSMAMMNKYLYPDIEIVCLMADLQYQYLSSSLLKEIVQLGGELDEMIPSHVSAALNRKFKHFP